MFKVKAKTSFNSVDMTLASNYDGSGLYLNDDGIMHNLVVVDGNTYVLSVPVPREFIVEVEDKPTNDFVEMVQRKLDMIINRVDVLTDEQSDVTWEHSVTNQLGVIGVKLDSSNTGSSSVDLEGLTKLIAVAQKPDIFKGK